MIEVFKCDYCRHFTQDAEEMRIHEQKCSFNPQNKTCRSCLYSMEDYGVRWCEKHLDTFKYEKGGCEEHSWDGF